MIAVVYCLAFYVLVYAVYLLILTCCATFPLKKKALDLVVSKNSLKVAVVIPAHNEELLLPRLLASLKRATPSNSRIDVVVVADNCTDDTATIARANGAIVLERISEKDKGKGYALQHAFCETNGRYSHYVIIDADSIVSTNYLLECEYAFENGYQAIQTKNIVKDPLCSPRGRILQLIFAGYNAIRSRGRSWLNLSVGIKGNGFGLSQELLKKVPYDAMSIAEDLEYHLSLLINGEMVKYLPSATVITETPSTEAARKIQGSRWDTGRFILFRQYALRLLYAIIIKNKYRLVDPLIELSMPPTSILLALSTLLVCLPFPVSYLSGLLALMILIFHYLVAWIQESRDYKDCLALAAVPFFILRKIATIPYILISSSQKGEWVRTPRAGKLKK